MKSERLGTIPAFLDAEMIFAGAPSREPSISGADRDGFLRPFRGDLWKTDANDSACSRSKRQKHLLRNRSTSRKVTKVSGAFALTCGR